ncbi:MAG: hypothetical protein QF570_20270 [Myxococcota bacterium]|jgi:hypothetical protein|nr:hypothetical protein [Myxococcota bacterium]
MTAPAAPTSPTSTGPVHTLIGWLVVLINVAYVVYGYYGFAPPPDGMPTDWWHGRTFILDWESMGGYVDAPITGALIWALPSALLGIAAFFTTRSAIARCLALYCVIASFLSGAAGFAAGAAWMLFSWHFTAVLDALAFALAATLTSALLVGSWLKLGTTLRCAIYLPVFVVVMAVVRGTTGTSESGSFGVSPWPVFTTFGLDNAVFVLCGLLFATAIGVLTFSRERFDGVSGLGLLVAITLPVCFAALRFPDLALSMKLALAAAAIVMIALAAFVRVESSENGLAGRGLRIALGAALVFLPILSGSALARGDFSANRYVQSPRVVDALQAHIKAEEFYPEKLEDLVTAGYLETPPRPRIGFGLLETLGITEPAAYRYNEYGSSFVLEFDSSLWVQCQYSGNYYFDEEEEEEYDEEDDWEPETPEWSCLDKRPALWGDEDAEGREEDDYGYDDDFEGEDDFE